MKSKYHSVPCRYAGPISLAELMWAFDLKHEIINSMTTDSDDQDAQVRVQAQACILFVGHRSHTHLVAP